jgi:hypothetical protein
MIFHTPDDWQQCGVQVQHPGTAFSKSFTVAARKAVDALIKFFYL